MLQFLVPSMLAVLAGAAVALQQVINAGLSATIRSAAWAGVISYALGLACMVLIAIAVRDPLPVGPVAARVPWWAWTGGMLGAIFIGLGIVLVPWLGAATFVALLVTGQMLASVALDHYGVLGLVPRTLDVSRAIGVLLLIGGVILIRR